MLAGRAACAWKLVRASLREGSEVGTDAEVEEEGGAGGLRGVQRVSREASRREAEYDSKPGVSSLASF